MSLFSANIGAIADDVTGSEEGFETGLAVEFDTWNNGGEGAATARSWCRNTDMHPTVLGRGLPQLRTQKIVGPDCRGLVFHLGQGHSCGIWR